MLVDLGVGSDSGVLEDLMKTNSRAPNIANPGRAPEAARNPELETV